MDIKAKKNLIYLVAVGVHDQRFYECISWCINSLRKWGKFEGEIIVITDSENPNLIASIGNQARIMHVAIESLVETHYARDTFESFFVSRLFIHELIDLSAYKNVMYLDADILAVNDINPLFENVEEFRYSREFQPMSAPSFSDMMTAEEIEKAKFMRGINSGVYIAPAHYLSTCLIEWKTLIDANPNAFCYDQTALNAAIIRKKFHAKPMTGFSVGYPVLAFFQEHFRPHTHLLHYCGNRNDKFKRMQLHYESLKADRPLQTIFEVNDSDEIKNKNNVSSGNKPLMTIALDDWNTIESHSLVNNVYKQQLQARGHRIISIEEANKGGIKPDVVINHNYTTDFLSGTFIEGVPHIAIRTSDFGPYPTQWAELINEKYQQLWVHSQWTKQNAIDAGIKESLIKVIPHGIDPTIFSPKGEHFDLPTKKRFRFLFVGGAAVRKGIDILLKSYAQAFTKDDDVCLVIKDSSGNVFYKDNFYRDQILAMVNDPTKPEVIHIDDHLSTEKLASLYRACSVGVWPYRGEGFLIPALESLACGTPTMLPDIGPTIDFSTERTSFLVPAIDVRLPIIKSFQMRLGFEIDVKSIRISEIKTETLIESMKQAYLTSMDMLKIKRESGLTMAHGRFKWSHAIDKIESVLEEIVSKSQENDS